MPQATAPLRTALRQSYRTLGFGALTVGTGVGIYNAVKHAPAPEKPAARDKWSGGWSALLLDLFDVEVVVHGNVPKDPSRGRVVVANHRSIIDISIMLVQFGGCVVARGDIESWPVLGPCLRAGGTIFVDRGDKKSGSNAVAKMMEHLQKHESISLFPEGTTFEDDEVRPFRPGGFVAAQRTSSPVTPVGIVYPEGSGAAYGGETFVAHLARLAGSKGTIAHVEVGAPMEPRDGESITDFAERSRVEVQRLVTVGRIKNRAAVSAARSSLARDCFYRRRTPPSIPAPVRNASSVILPSPFLVRSAPRNQGAQPSTYRDSPEVRLARWRVEYSAPCSPARAPRDGARSHRCGGSPADTPGDSTGAWWRSSRDRRSEPPRCSRRAPSRAPSP